jgi:prolyl-tRNA editing enzyme YbaK/EbsC (Cys-tRNA(Pro) deacylase)
VSGDDPLLLRRCLDLLATASVPVVHLEHAAASSSEEAARLRGVGTDVGTKALLVKAGGDFVLVAARVADRIDNRLLRHALRAQKMRFATTDELRMLTGCGPGRVPPIGRPLLDLPLYADRRLADGDRMWFTAGTTTDSIGIAVADWVRVAAPEWVDVGGG